MRNIEKENLEIQVAASVLPSILAKCTQLQYGYSGSGNILSEHIFLAKKIAKEMVANIQPKQLGKTEGFEIGDTVYLKTDKEQKERIVTGIMIRANGSSYAVSFETQESWHYDFELTSERDIVKATSN